MEQVQQDFRVQLEELARQVFLVLQVPKVIKVLLAQQVQQVAKAHKVYKVALVHKDSWVGQAAPLAGVRHNHIIFLRLVLVWRRVQLVQFVQRVQLLKIILIFDLKIILSTLKMQLNAYIN